MQWQEHELVGGQNKGQGLKPAGALTRIVWNLRPWTGGRSLRRTNSRSPRQACVNSSLDSLAMCTFVMLLAARLYLAAETDALETSVAMTSLQHKVEHHRSLNHEARRLL